MKPLRFVVAIALSILAFPRDGSCRSPLTDSTDVVIPTTRSEVENSIAVSPLDSKVLLLSNIGYSSQGNDGVTSWISHDAGKSWLVTDSLLLAQSLADPAVAIGRNGGTKGRYFINHMGSGYEQVVHYKNTTGGTSWTEVEITTGGQKLTDKNHLAINNNTSGSFVNRLLNAYSPLTASDGILAFFSTDNGASWNGPHTIAASSGGNDLRGINLQWGSASSSKAYGCWAIRTGGLDPIFTSIGFAISSNGGETWNPPSGGSAIQSVGGFDELPQKSMPLSLQAPVMAVDYVNEYLYIAYASKPSGEDANVYVIKSTDQGQTWGSPVQVHDVTSGKDQWYPWIAWDDCTGAIIVTYLDSRDFVSNNGANTYMSVSLDGGSTWEDFKVSDSGWDADGFPGHYMGLAAKDGIAFPVWSDDRVTTGHFKPYISPVYLWGVNQPSVSHSIVNDAGLQLTVSATWTTNLSATGTDYLVITSPTNVTYSGTASGSGTSHSAEKTCTCETGDWKYVVKSTRPGFTSRGSDQKSFRVYVCVD